MFKSLEGVYRDGKIELLEPAPPGAEGRVIITFLPTKSIDLAERGIDEEQAADLRRRLGAIAADWDRPEMDTYDALDEEKDEEKGTQLFD
ncbi:MAG: hypothetical protein O3C40_24330 [Planctomycetota bacterium]|nr:hypothetical protein [Planctomycetota bacterium]